MSRRVSIWTDGACSGNPGPGGWGAVLRYGGHEKELKGGEALTTNNRMELTAAIEALRSLTRPCEVILHTDSQYLRGGVTGWIDSWKSNGWRTAAKKPVKNEDLWRALDEAAEQHTIEWRWVKGHADDELNVRADQLARDGMAPYLTKAGAGRFTNREALGRSTVRRALLRLRAPFLDHFDLGEVRATRAYSPPNGTARFCLKEELFEIVFT